MAIAYGFFSLGIVLGWSALFLRGSTWRTRLSQLVWAGFLLLLIAMADTPWFAAYGIVTGALAHLFLQLGLEGRHV